MESGDSAQLRLLVVDDEPTYADMTAEWLELDGFEVTTAQSAAAALDELEAGYDCVVSDYDMAGMNGMELLQTIRERAYDLPFVLHTGHGNEALASAAIAAGVTDYVRKGYSQAHFVTLAARIRLAIERIRAERRFRATFTQGFDAMLIADDDGYYIDANPTAERVMGLPRSELLGRRISEFAEEEFDFDAAWNAFLEAGEQTGEFTLVRPDGDRRTLEFDAVTDIIPGEHLSVIRDITGALEREARLQAQQDALAAIASEVDGSLRERIREARNTLDGTGENGALERLAADLAALDDRLAVIASLAGDNGATDTRR